MAQGLNSMLHSLNGSDDQPHSMAGGRRPRKNIKSRRSRKNIRTRKFRKSGKRHRRGGSIAETLKKLLN